MTWNKLVNELMYDKFVCKFTTYVGDGNEMRRSPELQFASKYVPSFLLSL